MKIALKAIEGKGSLPAKHNQSSEFMVYADGEFEGNVSVYKQSHHSCKKKGFRSGGRVFEKYEDALKYGIKSLLDRSELLEIYEDAAMEVLGG